MIIMTRQYQILVQTVTWATHSQYLETIAQTLSVLCVRGSSFMFFPPIQGESCMRAKMLVLAKLHICVTGFLF